MRGYSAGKTPVSSCGGRKLRPGPSPLARLVAGQGEPVPRPGPAHPPLHPVTGAVSLAPSRPPLRPRPSPFSLLRWAPGLDPGPGRPHTPAPPPAAFQPSLLGHLCPQQGRRAPYPHLLSKALPSQSPASQNTAPQTKPGCGVQTRAGLPPPAGRGPSAPPHRPPAAPPGPSAACAPRGSAPSAPSAPSAGTAGCQDLGRRAPVSDASGSAPHTCTHAHTRTRSHAHAHTLTHMHTHTHASPPVLSQDVASSGPQALASQRQDIHTSQVGCFNAVIIKLKPKIPSSRPHPRGGGLSGPSSIYTPPAQNPRPSGPGAPGAGAQGARAGGHPEPLTRLQDDAAVGAADLILALHGGFPGGGDTEPGEVTLFPAWARSHRWLGVSPAFRR